MEMQRGSHLKSWTLQSVWLGCGGRAGPSVETPQVCSEFSAGEGGLSSLELPLLGSAAQSVSLVASKPPSSV